MRVRELILGSLAPATRTSYDGKVGEFLSFCKAQRLQVSWPLPVDHILQFMLFLHDEGLNPRSIAVYLAALAFVAGFKGVPDSTQNFHVRRMLEGMRRARPPSPDKRRPITTTILHGLIQRFKTCCSSDFELVLFRATVLIIFFGAFRVSEVLVKSRTADPAWVLWWSDLTITQSGCTLRLRKAKNDQRARGAMVKLRALPRHPLCPVRALINLRQRVVHHVGPIFQHADGEPLTIYQFRAIFSWAILSMGLSTRLYSIHSLRIGAATLASELGLSDEAIRRIGRWRSGAFKYYIRK